LKLVTDDGIGFAELASTLFLLHEGSADGAGTSRWSAPQDRLLTKAALAMNHQQVLQLAGWLAEHGANVVGRCRGIPVAALRRYLKARQTQFQAWSEVLSEKQCDEHFPQPDTGTDEHCELLTAIREIAPHGILVRVASTILYSIGERLDIPLAVDVATRTARSFSKVVQMAMAAVALRTQIPASELSGLDRLGRLSDRLSDLLCGALLPTLRCDRFVVDRGRAADFAQTFGRQPSLVRVPLRKAALAMPAEASAWKAEAAEVEHSLLECLPILANYRSARPDELNDLVETFAPKIYLLPERNAEPPARPPTEPPRPLAFPTLSFTQVLRKARDSRGN
jgi:hypothetical protein